MAGDGAANLWDAGDYPEVARRLEPAAVAIAETAGLGRGRMALDVAAGTGSVALRLADQGWSTSATDLSERMVGLGRAATTAAAQEIDWRVADLAEQPFDDDSQDLVTSSFGLIFAPDARAAVDEIVRVLTPAGRLILTTWADDGYMAQMTEIMMAYLPARTGSAPQLWGTPAWVRDLLRDRFLDVAVERRSLGWSFASAAAGRAWLERTSPAHIAAVAAADDGVAMMDAVEQHLATYADRAGRIGLAAEYLLISARRIP